MTGSGARALLFAVVCVALTAAAAVAQDVPTPTPRPKGAPAVAPQQTPAPAPAAAEAAPKGFFPFSFSLGGKGGGQQSQATAFDNKQRALLDKISNYLSSVQTMVGNFVHIGPDCRRVDVNFSIQKPGKVRFQYNPPRPIDMIADGSSLVVRDRSLEMSYYFPLSQTPLL
jgi:hypothetical protein